MELVNIEGKSIERIEYKGQPVITFRMIDELHERPEGTARKSFHRNKDQFIGGEDFFEIPYEEWSQTLSIHLTDDQKGGYRGSLTVMTESGYLMIVKPFSDDLAWRIQRALVRNYFMIMGYMPVSERVCYYRKGKRRKGAPKETHVSARVPKEVRERLIKISQVSGLTLSSVIEQAVCFYLKHGLKYSHEPRLEDDTDMLRQVPIAVQALRPQLEELRDIQAEHDEVIVKVREMMRGPLGGQARPGSEKEGS